MSDGGAHSGEFHGKAEGRKGAEGSLVGGLSFLASVFLWKLSYGTPPIAGVSVRGMGFYDDVVVPYCVELACGQKKLRSEREKTAQGLRGRVLEIGFGSGLNVGMYPDVVTRIFGVEPSVRARKIGRRRIEGSAQPIEFVGLEAEKLGLTDASVDSALSTFTLCTIPGIQQALAEVRRVLVPGGSFHFLEHGRAPDARVARWQDRLNGIQQFMAGGCNLNRDIPSLVEAAGFRLESLEAAYHPAMPRPMGYLYRGKAIAT